MARARGANSDITWLGARAQSVRLVRSPSVPELLKAIARVRSEAALLADNAYVAIQRHAFDPYRKFCEKRKEHAALASVLRSHIGLRPEDPSWARVVSEEESSLVRLSIQACVKFAFALSAKPLMPLGARETFITEIAMLHAAREHLWPIKDDEGIANLLSEIDLALMILEEIIEKAPAFDEF
jgi:hypothetical protein